jgi:hypothetical protein
MPSGPSSPSCCNAPSVDAVRKLRQSVQVTESTPASRWLQRLSEWNSTGWRLPISVVAIMTSFLNIYWEISIIFGLAMVYLVVNVTVLDPRRSRCAVGPGGVRALRLGQIDEAMQRL